MHQHYLHNHGLGLGQVLAIWLLVTVVFIGLAWIWTRPSNFPQPRKCERRERIDLVEDRLDELESAFEAHHHLNGDGIAIVVEVIDPSDV